ncbi:MAG TPA: thioredoxin domain-containing protein [Chloroflexota bacterium]|nr:thioredoxin domain-containing protein [Chloroflexota bacterium]
MPNRLINETSPYLLQHAHNPVDWYPWGEEALARAKSEDKPILLSIGYSACHWCHVMERESFENDEIAALMNRYFVSIKVDREERPDLDSIYMSATQAMTQHGGWPMTVFLTPDGAPYYAGTYFPPTDRGGMPGFARVVESLGQAYQTERERVVENAARIRAFLEQQSSPHGEHGELSPAILTQAVATLKQSFDWTNGGFRGAPKFPQPMNLETLLREWRRSGDDDALHMVEHTLHKMIRGGIHDQLGGGFHRYSVDAKWLVPHFEKMLYDNAQLSRLLLETYQATGKSLYQRAAIAILDYVRREMTDPAGGFYSSQDADSEGEEGKFFVWTPAEVLAVVGRADAPIVCRYFDVTASGNFEGKNILNVPEEPEVVAEALSISVEELESVIARARARLFEAREQRVRPGRDDKVLTAWNGLMLRAFATAARIFGRGDFQSQAETNARFLLAELRRDGRLLRTWKDGQAHLNGYLEDYAFLIDGLVALHEATLDPAWLIEARGLTDTMLDLFWVNGEGFYDTARDHEQLVARPRDVFDNATPSGTSVAAEVLLRIASLTGEGRYADRAREVLQSMAPMMTRAPGGFGRLLAALDFEQSPPRELAIIGRLESTNTRRLLDAASSRYEPNLVLAGSEEGDRRARAFPVLTDRTERDGTATAYVCEHYVCQAPVTSPEELQRLLS